MITTAEIAGNSRITPRALQRLVAAIAAELLGTSIDKVRASVTDSASKLAIEVSGPLAVAPLGQTVTLPLTQHLELVRSELAAKVTALSGREVITTALEITAAEIKKEGRVK